MHSRYHSVRMLDNSINTRHHSVNGLHHNVREEKYAGNKPSAGTRQASNPAHFRTYTDVVPRLLTSVSVSPRTA